MFSILSKIFIKQDLDEAARRNAYGLLTGAMGIVINTLLSIFKIIIGITSKSLAISADGYNNLSDAGASFVTMVGFRLAMKKPDKDHPHGHGRMEYVAGLAVAGLILLMALSLLKDSIIKIINPESTVFSFWVIITLIGSIIVKLYMAAYNRHAYQLTGSSTILAVSKDSLMDCIATFAALLSMLIEYFFQFKIDGYCGAFVALIILKAGKEVLQDTLDPLLGQPPRKEFVDQLLAIATSFDPKILGMHDLMVHDYGPGRIYVTFHAEVSANENVLELHEIIDALEKKLGNELNCYVTIHMDPIVTDNAGINSLKEKVEQMIKDLDSSYSIHDFRVVPGKNNTNLIFDVLIPFDSKYKDKELLAIISQEAEKRLGAGYSLVVQIDRDFGTV